MCLPLAAVAVAATVMSAAVSAYGMVQSSNAQSKAANYQAEVAQQNQLYANQQAQDALARGQQAQAIKAQQTAQMEGRQRASLAANGVEVNTGSAVDLQSDTAAAGTLDDLTIRSNAEREAAGYQQQGLNYSNEAQLDEMKASQAQTAGALGATSTVLAGAGSVAGQWYNYNNGTRISRVNGNLGGLY